MRYALCLCLLLGLSACKREEVSSARTPAPAEPKSAPVVITPRNLPTPTPIAETGPASLSFALDASTANPDCPTLKSLKKEENQFTLSSDTIGDFFKPGTTTEYTKGCVVKGTVLVPAGYIVNFDVQERIGAADFSLDTADSAGFRIDLNSSVDGKAYLSSLVYEKLGEITAFDEPVVFERDSKTETLITCADFNSAPRAMNFSATIFYKVTIPAKSPSEGGAMLSKVPTLVFKPKKCDPTAPNAPSIETKGPVEAARFSFEVDEEASRKNCPFIKSFGKADDKLNFTIDPITLELKDPARFLQKTCTVQGKVVVPAKSVVTLQAATLAIAATVDIDKGTKFVQRYNSRFFSADEPVKSSQQVTLDGPQKGDQTWMLTASKPADDCAQAKADNTTVLFELDYMQLFTRTDIPKTPVTVTIKEMPSLQFTLKTCP